VFVSLRIVSWIGVGDLTNSILLYRPISAYATLLLGYSAMRYGPDSSIGDYRRSCFVITLDKKMHANQH